MNLLFLQDADPQLCLLELPLELHDLHQKRRFFGYQTVNKLKCQISHRLHMDCAKLQFQMSKGAHVQWLLTQSSIATFDFQTRSEVKMSFKSSLPRAWH